MTFDTAALETPATRATSSIVIERLNGLPGGHRNAQHADQLGSIVGDLGIDLGHVDGVPLTRIGHGETKRSSPSTTKAVDKSHRVSA